MWTQIKCNIKNGWTEGMTQVVEHLLCKCKALSLNPSSTKKKKKKCSLLICNIEKLRGFKAKKKCHGKIRVLNKLLQFL
jgi:hypothetical protein